MKKLLTIFIMVLFLSVAVNTATGQSPEIGPINVGLTSSGGTDFSALVAMAEGLRKGADLNMKPMPIPGSIPLFAALKDGTIEFTMTGTADTIAAFLGAGDFKKAGWEPQSDLRQVYTAYSNPLGIAVRADSDIETLYDLKGKRMAFAETSTSYTLGMQAMAAWIDADFEKDFKKVISPGYSDSILYVKDGQADFALSSLAAANAYETAASPHDLRWVPYDPSDEEGAQRWRDFWPFPAYRLFHCPPGYGAAIPEEGAYGYAAILTWVCYKDKLSAEEVYTVVKGLSHSYQYFWDATPVLYQATLANNSYVKNILPLMPLHEGTVQYLTEVGCYSPQMAEEQEKRLEALELIK